ncbi:hypothetical protein PENTCL1PPCAC_28480, partial [Pristionchus entomophagus]
SMKTMRRGERGQRQARGHYWICWIGPPSLLRGGGEGERSSSPLRISRIESEMRSAIMLLSLAAYVAASTACPESSKTAYFVIDNTELITTETLEFSEFSEEECQSTCSSNVDNKGKSIECASFAYDHVSFTCTFYVTKSLPEGKAATKQAVGKRYFEKFCLSESSVPTCAEAQFIRADDSVLIGFAANVSLVDSLEECVSTCVKEPACKSAMYFYEEGECITNTESALSRPASFAREDTEKVIYFQNGCLTRSAFVESSSTRPVENIDFEAETKKTRGESASAELPLSGEEEESEEEPVTTTKAPKKRRSKTTTSAVTTTTTTEAPEDLEAEYDEDDKEEEPSTTVAPKKKESKKRGDEKEVIKKFKKHPKNFASKTVHYKAQKGAKTNVAKVSNEEEVDPADSSIESVDDETDLSDPYTTFFSEWSDWTPCKTSGERRIRRRKCLDLRRCLGALMQVENCPALTTKTPELVTEDELKSVRSIVAAPLEGDPLAGIDTVTSSPEPEVEIAQVGASDVGDGYIWSPWLGTCQKFASGQPCNNNEMIGFESRECVAKDPSQCQGPFFRYCTLPC